MQSWISKFVEIGESRVPFLRCVSPSVAAFVLYLAILLAVFLQSCAGYLSFEPRVYRKSPLYLAKVGVRFAYILPSPHSTCGITLGLLLLLVVVKVGYF